MSGDDAKRDACIRALEQAFGRVKIDRDVLMAVAEMHGYDSKAAVKFLQAGDGDFVEPPTTEAGGTLPKDYQKKPKGWTDPHHGALQHPAVECKEFFLTENSPFVEHLRRQREARSVYCSVLLQLLHLNVELSTTCKSRCLAAAWARSDRDLWEFLLYKTKEGTFGLPEILRAVRLLDGPRRVRALEKRVRRLEQQGSVKPRKLKKIRTKIAELLKETPATQKTSVSGALQAHIRKWCSTLPVESLEFFALQMPKEPWVELADTVHCKVTDFQLSWFLPCVFGAPPPLDSLLLARDRLLPGDITGEVAERLRLPYSFLRKKLPVVPTELRASVAKYEKIDMLLWYHEELTCPEVDATLVARLVAGEAPTFGYGKLMERLLYARGVGATALVAALLPVAEARLHTIALPLEPPVVVFGDSSFSMDVAVRTSSIIGSLLAALCRDSELRFFNVRSIQPEVLPRTAAQVLELASTIKPDGLTAPAVSLWEYYKERKHVRFFIVVSDEIENIGHACDPPVGEQYFAQLFYMYCRDVCPARLVMVSFLDENQIKNKLTGRMTTALEAMGISPLCFRLDGRRPDLTKVDSLLGMLSSEGSAFASTSDALAARLTDSTTFKMADLQQQLLDHRAGLLADKSPAATSSSAAAAGPTAN